MFLIQLAATLLIIHVIARRNLNAALSPARLLAQLAEGKKLQMPFVTAYIVSGSFWAASLIGLAGIWTFA